MSDKFVKRIKEFREWDDIPVDAKFLYCQEIDSDLETKLFFYYEVIEQKEEREDNGNE